MLGENIYSQLDLGILEYNEEKKEGFLVCSHKHVGTIKAILTLVSYLGDKQIIIHPLGISGTVKTLNRKFLNR
jgi:RNase P/RNase MRP subunit POP5|tara:strand:- start:657 stop:875 length:219 start_codon:yes stop_codon:yes gene_type:complete